MSIQKTESNADIVHWLIHDACSEIAQGNFDEAKNMLYRADKLSHDLPRWVSITKLYPQHSDWVAARRLDGNEYKYTGLAKEGDRVFIGEETMHDINSHELQEWEWLDEGINPVETTDVGKLAANLLGM